MTSQSSPSGWDRLQTLLLTIEPNQTITLDDVVTDTGLSPEMVRMVLNGLAAAGLFEEPETNVFVRRSLFQHTMMQLAVA
jgi:DNA-binding GntR family transcriptional regulator